MPNVLNLVIFSATPLNCIPIDRSFFPHFRELVSFTIPTGGGQVEDDSPDDGLDIVLAQAYSMPHEPGRIAWAALQSKTIGVSCAWIEPVHMQASLGGVYLTDPQELLLTQHQSEQLLLACAPILAEEQISVEFIPNRAWLAKGKLLEGLTCWSLRRALGRSLQPHQLFSSTDSQNNSALMRLFNEIQMLLSAHPINEQRQEQGLAPVNALWIHGAGRLDELDATESRVEIATIEFQNGIEAVQALQRIDAQEGSHALNHLQKGGKVNLSFCSSYRWQTFHAPARSALQARLLRWIGVPAFHTLLENL